MAKAHSALPNAKKRLRARKLTAADVRKLEGILKKAAEMVKDLRAAALD